MHIHLLTQAYNIPSDKPVGAKLVELLADNRFHTFTALSAFSSRAGVAGIAAGLTAAQGHIKKATIITGIDQKGTSTETLQDLMALGIHTFIFYQKESVIFHPKIYLFECNDFTTLIVGSANLTSNGLFGNVEAAVALEIENGNKEDYAIVDSLKAYFAPLLAGTDPNLIPITEEAIKAFVSAGIVPTEAEGKALFATQNPKPTVQNALQLRIPKCALAKIPAQFRRQKKGAAAIKTTVPKLAAQMRPSLLLWQSGPLTERDLGIPKGEIQTLPALCFLRKAF